MTKRGEARAFLEEAVSSQTDECIIWPFGTITDSKGKKYGMLRIDDKIRGAHREVCKRAHGDPPLPKAVACHALKAVCGSTLCINPRHLRWGTKSEDALQRRDDGTVTEFVPRKYSRDCVVAIFFDQRSQAEIAANYGVSLGTVGSIKRGDNLYSKKLFESSQPDAVAESQLLNVQLLGANIKTWKTVLG